MLAFERSLLETRLRDRLLSEARPSGGWSYYPGKRSRVESTSWVLLALADSWNGDQSARQRFIAPHLQFLSSCQRDNGLLTDTPEISTNFTADGLAACVFAHLSTDQDPTARRLRDGLVSAQGVAVQQDASSQDNSLRAWPWIPETFSWVEPTSWCLLALKKTRTQTKGTEPRIREAEKMLANRSCKAGGWNYGNSAVFGQDLRAYVPTTAVALLALQDRQTDPTFARALAFLEDARLKESSGMALAIAAMTLRLLKRPAHDVEERLTTTIAGAERMGNLQTLAMALFALSGERHEVKAFRV